MPLKTMQVPDAGLRDNTVVGNIAGVRCTAHAWRGPAGARRAGAAPTAAWTSVPPPARDMDSKLWIPSFPIRCTNGSNVAW